VTEAAKPASVRGDGSDIDAEASHRSSAVAAFRRFDIPLTIT